MNNEYIEECKENAILKKKLEIELLQTKSAFLPIETSTFENNVYLSTFPGTLESHELVMEWIRELRLGNDYKDVLIHQISSHEAFIALYAVNSLRRNKNPNFLYYHGVVEIKGEESLLSIKEQIKKSPKLESIEKSTYYALTEDLFTEEENYDMFSLSFRDVCEKENWIVIVSYYISILLALSNANKDILYTNYDLNLDNIMMRNMNNPIFDVEYNFNNSNVWVTNYGYVPTITRYSKSYTKVYVENVLKSFGYNNISQIPYEPKGIYCDRGFVISDAYALLMYILECTHEKNIEAYEKIKIFHNFFSKDEPNKHFKSRYFVPYFDKTSNMTIERYIKYILKIYPEFVLSEPKNDVLRCIGFNLEIKSKTLDYYTIKNTIQLYDYIKYYTSFVNPENESILFEIVDRGIKHYNKYYEKDNVNNDIDRINTIEFELYQHSVLFEFPENIDIMDNPKYIRIFSEYINSCIKYFNTWERVRIGMKIMTYLEKNSELIKDMNQSYKKVIDDNEEYYLDMYRNLINIRQKFRNNLSLYKKYKNQILFLETLE